MIEYEYEKYGYKKKTVCFQMWNIFSAVENLCNYKLYALIHCFKLI